MRIDILTLFPELFTAALGTSILGRAAAPRGAGDPPVAYHLTDIREHTPDPHQKVDRPPYGGGPGMVMQCEPIWRAVTAAESADPRPATRILFTPAGERLTQARVESLARRPRLLLVAGHYEGIDERVIERIDPLRVSLGDYVLSGGELAALVLVDAVVRLLPGVLGNEASAECESFSAATGGGLDHPHYTRPRTWAGREVPEVLLSGDHARIAAARAAWAREQTRRFRPDLLADEKEEEKRNYKN